MRRCSGYNAADYAHLNVPEDVRELFQYIGRYKPHNIALDTKLKCFIPDYIPSVGEIDAFIKVCVSALFLVVAEMSSQHDDGALDVACSEVSALGCMGYRGLEQVDRPDGKPEALGLKQLDEPAAVQSDPTVLDLQLRAVSKTATLEPMTV